MSTNSKPSATTKWNDQRIEIVIGKLLRAGVLLSAAVVIVGGIVYLMRQGHTVASYHNFQGEHSPLRTFTGIASGVRQFRGLGIIQAGLLLLIATPVCRVLFSAIAFARERDYLYVGLTLTVLAVLLYSLFGPYLH